ncbi:hypothetical protein IQK56_12715 [Pseudomonas sp. MAFF 301449]|uniref:Uncharacterized protein n=1 Tax=Pseudomonas cyclaminis TaxID=2781239 RepID=A0ABR9SS60_9PSED|nr:hypothetical protein [Pseudomonas cyclaminis]MBE8591728.1 hypothetical protein [Pseudomonas cyclaminis]MBE8602988.1 hypothetical protein [Pseudomonas cyclaminis]
MDNLTGFALSVLSSAGVTTALLVALGWLLRNWIGERLKAGIRFEYADRLEKLKAVLKDQGDAQLATLRSEQDRQAEKLRIASASFSEVQKATIARKIDAVDSLWATVVASKKAMPTVFHLLDQFNFSELKGDGVTYLHKLADELDHDAVLALVTALYGDVQILRPHLGEYVWTLFSSFQSILSRIIYLLALSQDDPNRFSWHLDDEARRLISLTFGKELLHEFDSLDRFRIEWLRHRFERNLLAATEKLLTGQAFSQAALDQAQLLDAELFKASALMAQNRAL